MRSSVRLLVTLVAMIGLVPVLDVVSARATFPGDNGMIVFEHLPRPGDVEICAVAPGSSSIPVRLTDNDVDDFAPAWSSDGEILAFTRRSADSSEDILSMNANGTSQRELFNSRVNDRNPSFAPDGSFVVFGRGGGNEQGISRYTFASGNRTDLTTSPTRDRDPEVSPDGTMVAFTRAGSNPRSVEDTIVVVDAASGGIITTVAGPGRVGQASWSPDGTRLAYSAHDGVAGNSFEIWVVNVDGTNRRQLTDAPGDDLHPAWSPDGTKLAFTSDRPTDTLRSELFVMDADGSNPIRLTFNDDDEGSPSWRPSAAAVEDLPNSPCSASDAASGTSTTTTSAPASTSTTGSTTSTTFAETTPTTATLASPSPEATPPPASSAAATTQPTITTLPRTGDTSALGGLGLALVVVGASLLGVTRRRPPPRGGRDTVR